MGNKRAWSCGVRVFHGIPRASYLLSGESLEGLSRILSQKAASRHTRLQSLVPKRSRSQSPRQIYARAPRAPLRMAMRWKIVPATRWLRVWVVTAIVPQPSMRSHRELHAGCCSNQRRASPTSGPIPCPRGLVTQIARKRVRIPPLQSLWSASRY